MPNKQKVQDYHQVDIGRILIVDDEEDFPSSLADILESRGYNVITALNDEDAFRRQLIGTDSSPDIESGLYCQQ